jgi:uncharacterized protein DUF4252
MDLTMKISTTILFAALTIAPLAIGQKLELKLDDIAAKASKKNEVDLDGPLLKAAVANLPQLAAKHAKTAKDGKEVKESPLGAQLPALLSAVTGVYVRNYGFDKPGTYADGDLDGVRKQVGDGSGWMRIIRVKEKGESTEIYLLNHGEEIAGCLILVAQPKELTVVHVTGAATMAQMKELVNSDIKYDLSALMKQAGGKQ